MIRPILKHGDSGLHAPAAPVKEITEEIQTLIDDMIKTMYAAPGVGLAAPQVGVGLRIFVVDISVGEKPTELIAMVNPSLETNNDDTLITEEEGCLSLPGFSAVVERRKQVVVSGLDRNGRNQKIEGEGLLARAFQHEMDHLNGTLFVDRLRGIKRELIMRRIAKLRRNRKW
jgi:peptide deformylase